jgi:sporulation protein YlmC with PRC-barrel domain
MRFKLLLGGLFASAFIIPVVAQQAPTPAPETPAAQPAPATPSAQPAPAARTEATTTTRVAMTGQWRASKLIGLDVYNEQNEKLGDINEILLDQSGKVNGVVIGVGGFLGMGQREIMITMDQLKFVNEPHRTASTPRPATTGTTSTSATAPAGTPAGDRARTTDTVVARTANEKWYPDHAILSGATKDSLKAMTEWKYN